MKRRSRKRQLSVPERHQLNVARKTLRMPDAIANYLGGMTKAEAGDIIKRLTGKTAKEDEPLCF